MDRLVLQHCSCPYLHISNSKCHLQDMDKERPSNHVESLADVELDEHFMCKVFAFSSTNSKWLCILRFYMKTLWFVSLGC
jgi:hypothetical protein